MNGQRRRVGSVFIVPTVFYRDSGKGDASQKIHSNLRAKFHYRSNRVGDMTLLWICGISGFVKQ